MVTLELFLERKLQIKVNRNGQKNETQIIKLMKQNPQITQAEITGFRRSTITNHIRILKETHY